MTEFVLRIFFSGLIALLPNAEGTEVVVLLVNTPHEYALANGAPLAHHTPLLLARAGACEGTCTTTDNTAIAQLLYSNKTPQQALTALNGAILSGGAWKLASSDLTLQGPGEPLAIRTDVRTVNEDGTLQLVPMTPAQREDFTWVTSLSKVSPGIGGFKAAVTSPDPPPGCMIAARLKLRSGKLFTYSLVKIDGKARPVHFRKPSGEGPEAPYAQAAANWVAAEIRVPGDSVEIVDQKFTDSENRRSMKLYPEQGVVEVAVLNLPPFIAPAPDTIAPTPAPGQHFQIYYDLVQSPPARADRLIPHTASPASPSEPQVDWNAVHPKAELWSNLLEQLNLNPRAKAPYDLSLCPIVKYP
ncbi:MAG TPA: hypothetical protein VEK79_14015 [Thermoanaerobaculia bacterium]|nr:hypothetical protein [Thermoanaerobaculia bacterium]